MAAALNLPVLGPLSVNTDTTVLSQEWERFVGHFAMYLAAAGVTDKKQQRALLLHLAGPDVQDVFVMLPDTGDADAQDTAPDKLTGYSASRRNIPFLRHQFRQATQETRESIDSFVNKITNTLQTLRIREYDEWYERPSGRQ